MKEIRLGRASCVKGEVRLCADKSISHRIGLLSTFLDGRMFVKNFSDAADCRRTLSALSKIGIKIKREENSLVFESNAVLHEPDNVLNVGNSGTSARLLLGILSSIPQIHAVLTGDSSLRRRPMRRVAEPLRMMGAQIWGRAGDFLPMSIMGQRLRPIHYTMKVASAQVKSAIIFASLFTEGESFIEEPLSSRDHTERMLSFFGAKIKREDGKIRVKGPFSLKGEFFYQVPFDISAAAFFIVAATLLEGSCIYIRDVCINPTRIGFLKTLSRMGAKIKIKRKRALFNEDIADIHVEHSHLKGVDIKAEQVPLQIDEIPILCIAASMAEGVTCIRGAKELRYKETDRIKAMTEGLRKCGVKVKELEDGLIIEGRRSIKGASFFSFGDHRIAMAFCIASLVADGESVIKDTSCISTSFPEFESSLNECVRW